MGSRFTKSKDVEADSKSKESAENPAPLSPRSAELPKLDVPDKDKYKNRNRRKSVSAEVDVDPNEKWEKKVLAKSPEVYASIEQVVSKQFLFAGLDKDQLHDVINAMDEKKVLAEEVIIRQGDPGDFYYVIASGEYDVWKQDATGNPQRVFTYEGKGSFGEAALMYNCPRLATVKAVTPGVLWALDRATFRHIIIDVTSKQRKLYESFLEKVPLLSKLTSHERAMVADCLEPVTFEDGQLVIKRGDIGDKFYIIEKGEAIATQPIEGADGKVEEVEVGRMKVGQYFGERALITNQPRAADVKAVGFLKVASLDRAGFERLMGDVKEIMKRQIDAYQTASAIRKSIDDGPRIEE